MGRSAGHSRVIPWDDTGVPRFRQIETHILSQIANGVLKPGEKLPCQRKWAAEVGVSYETMSRAVRNLVTRGVLDAAPRRGTVVAKRDRRRHVGAIGLVSHTPLIEVFRSRYQSALLPILQDALVENHERVIYERWTPSRTLMSMFQRMEIVDGVLLFGNCAYPTAQIKAVERMGIPVIVVGTELNDPDVWNVRSDDVADTRNAVRQLASMGYTSIAAWVDGRDDIRAEGYMQGLRDAGLVFRPEMLLLDHHDDVVGRLMRLKPRAQSFMFLRHLDRVQGVLAEMQNARLRIGRDIYICSYDADLWGYLAPLGVPYAHIEQQTHELAARTAQLMIDRVKGRPTGPVHTLLPSRFIAVSARPDNDAAGPVASTT